MKFVFRGVLDLKGNKVPFEKEIEGKSEKHALDLLYAYFGAKNKVKRSKIKIEEVKKG